MSASYNVCLRQREEQLRQREEEERGREEQERQRVAHLKKEMQELQAVPEVLLISYVEGRKTSKKSVQD